ncbi:MAG TPA: hypothetical protein VEL47_03525 [Myxococcota bacterium]|nr:hypothetical protein [Myxococcota bacterium]
MLAGEYAVLFGEKALVVGIDRQAICTFDAGASYKFFSKTHAPHLQQNHHPLFGFAIKACADAGFHAMAGTYTIDTSTFFDQTRGHKLGLGSSAAATTALCKMILHQHGVRDEKKLFDCAFLAHRSLNGGQGSGVDIAAAVYGGLISYRFEHERPMIKRERDNEMLQDLIIIDTGHAQSTQTFVAKVFDLKNRAPGFLADFCQDSSKLCDELLTSTDVLAKAHIFEKLYELLKLLGERAAIDIVSQAHAQIFHLAKLHGGSAKPSGAGGGDIWVTIIPNPHKDLFVKGIEELGFCVLKFNNVDAP